jgi:LmbE family N-acetylglucosaminyl deacetylase
VSGRNVVVSTHFDDAALSLGGSVERALVVTVRAGVPADPLLNPDWDARCGFGSAREAVEARREEDRASCAALGWEPVHLDLADGQYGDPVDPDAVRQAVAEQVGPEDLLWIPAGIGHADHVATRDALLPLLAERPSGLGRLYADLPYVARLGRRIRSRRHLGVELGRVVVCRLDTGRLARKRVAVEAHASQIPALRQGFPTFDASLRAEAWWPLGPMPPASCA